MIWKDGDMVCTVARDGARQARVASGWSVPIWTGMVYEARTRRHGRLTWHPVGSFGGTTSGKTPSQVFIERLKEEAEFPWLDDVRFGQLCNPEHVEA